MCKRARLTRHRATKFAANDSWGSFYRNLFGQSKMNQPLSILTGATAGATEAFVVVPFELVKIRASQLNGCAYCIDMHTKDARRAGETEQRIYAINAWRETPFFSERERAALEWTEALTRLVDSRVSDALFERVRRQFDEAELVALGDHCRTAQDRRHRRSRRGRLREGGGVAGMYAQ